MTFINMNPNRIQIAPLVHADIDARIAKGTAQYGEPLTSHNSRDSLQDAYEEAIDLSLYLRQAIEERNRPRSMLLIEHNGNDGRYGFTVLGHYFERHEFRAFVKELNEAVESLDAAMKEETR